MIEYVTMDGIDPVAVLKVIARLTEEGVHITSLRHLEPMRLTLGCMVRGIILQNVIDGLNRDHGPNFVRQNRIAIDD